jgi:hypothetical protein
MTPPPLRRKLSPTPSAPTPPASVWTEAKVKAVLAAYRSFVMNAAMKHGIPPAEVEALVRDHQCDPGD